jgi:hypothetical protein
MKIYEPMHGDGYEFCHPIDENFSAIVGLCNGTARAKTWEPLNMELFRVDDGGKTRRGRFALARILHPHIEA